jgi:hypothetical protein
MQIFLLRKVFNTSVNKFVEKLASSKANYTLLSTLTRFALFRCKYFAHDTSHRELRFEKSAMRQSLSTSGAVCLNVF